MSTVLEVWRIAALLILGGVGLLAMIVAAVFLGAKVVDYLVGLLP